MQKKCQICNELFIPNSGENDRKYCSLQCYWISKVGKTHSGGAKISAKLKGVKKSPEHVAKVAAALRGRKRPEYSGEKHHAWQGDKVRYDSLHDWVARYRGCEKKCSECGLDDPSRTYHWGNVSGEYRRDLADWKRLCVPCHSKMDAGRDDMSRVWKKVGNAYIRR